jgi:hypothetical protein
MTRDAGRAQCVDTTEPCNTLSIRPSFPICGPATSSSWTTSGAIRAWASVRRSRLWGQACSTSRPTAPTSTRSKTPSPSQGQGRAAQSRSAHRRGALEHHRPHHRYLQTMLRSAILFGLIICPLTANCGRSDHGCEKLVRVGAAVVVAESLALDEGMGITTGVGRLSVTRACRTELGYGNFRGDWLPTAGPPARPRLGPFTAVIDRITS